MTKPETEWVLVPRDLLSRIDDLLNSVDLTGTGHSPSKRVMAQAEADCDAVRALLASPPAPSVGDVVREWELLRAKNVLVPSEALDCGDRMAQALGVSEANRVMWHDLAKERLGEMQRLEAKSTAQAAEVERLTKRVSYLETLDAEHISARTIQNRVLGEECEKRRTAESSLETARGALEAFAGIALIRDADPTGIDAIDAPDLAVTPTHVRAAREALAALSSPPITKGADHA